MNQFVSRVVNYVANEIIIKGLANSRTFQRFAVRTDKSLQDLHKQTTEHLGQVLEAQVRTASTTAGASGPPQPPLRGFRGFVVAFIKEVRKDFGG